MMNKATDTHKVFCTFSRVIPEKGIDDAIEAIKELNESGIESYLDIWGANRRKLRRSLL